MDLCKFCIDFVDFRWVWGYFEWILMEFGDFVGFWSEFGIFYVNLEIFKIDLGEFVGFFKYFVYGLFKGIFWGEFDGTLSGIWWIFMGFLSYLGYFYESLCEFMWMLGYFGYIFFLSIWREFGGNLIFCGILLYFDGMFGNLGIFYDVLLWISVNVVALVLIFGLFRWDFEEFLAIFMGFGGHSDGFLGYF